MEPYHVTLRENLESILRDGLRPSVSGLDGPGIYLWKGPLASAVKEADMSLSENHYQMGPEEYDAFTKGLVMLGVQVPGDTVFTVEWPEYVVWDVGLVPKERIDSVGSLYGLLEEFYSQSGVSQTLAGAAGRSGENLGTPGTFQMIDFER